MSNQDNSFIFTPCLITERNKTFKTDLHFPKFQLNLSDDSTVQKFEKSQGILGYTIGSHAKPDPSYYL